MDDPIEHPHGQQAVTGERPIPTAEGEIGS